MRGFVAAVVALSLLLAACGPVEEIASQDDVDPTAAYESARATIVAQRRGETSPTARATPTPTKPATPTQQPMTPPPAADLAPLIDILQFLPANEQLPGEFMMTEDRVVTAEEIANGYADPEEHLVRLEEWGFVQLHSRRYELPNSLLITGRMNIFFVSVYQYGSREQAEDAARWNADWFATCGCWDNIVEQSLTPAWQTIFGLSGTSVDEPNLYFSRVYLINGPILVRVEGHARDIDPTPEVDAFIQSVYGPQVVQRQLPRSPAG